MSELVFVIVGVIIGLILGYLMSKSMSGDHISRRVKVERRDAIKQSKAVNLWNISEQLAPVMPQFPYHIKDMVFIGKGFDYLVLDGLSEWNLRQIIFLEIKTGRSTQNRNERMIQQVINTKLVKYEVMRI
jgi:predicted Holliday junction resolvase-like endonuclease